MPGDTFMPPSFDLNRPKEVRNPSRPVTKSISLFCVWSTLISALRSHPGLLAGRPAMLGLVISDARADLQLYKECCERLCRRLIEVVPNIDRRVGFAVHISDDFDLLQSRASDEYLFSSHRWVFNVANSENDLAEDFRSVADAILSVRPVSAMDIKAAARLVVGLDITDQEAEMAALLPLTKLDAVLRPGRQIPAVRQMLNTLIEQKEASVHAARPSLTLDKLPGMGEATTWGLCLAKELADWKHGKLDWNDLDRGIVLSGPSGTGKTTYARALAGSCGVPLIATSLAKWQACGHLGDTLKAMRKAFAQAIKAAPSILFIDEIDSLGDRNQFSGENSHYSYQVVTGLLEALDGIDERQGVVVVGACNYPRHLDKALLRPGRLDKHVRIPLPDHAARTAILKFHGASFLDSALDAIAARTEGRSGAFLEQLVRGGRRRARNEGRQLEVADLVAGLPTLVPVPKEIQWRIAVHEAGHAVVASVLGAGDVEKIVVSRDMECDGEYTIFRGGVTSIKTSPMKLRTRSDYLGEIAVRFGGLVAEELEFGNATDGSGSAIGSDLEKATRLAEALVGSTGMGTSFMFRGEPGSASLKDAVRWNAQTQKEIDTVLREAYRRARSIILSERLTVHSLASALFSAGSIEGEKILELTKANK